MIVDAQTEQTVQDVADRIGEDRATIGVKPIVWENLLQAGVTVELHVGRWRAVAQIDLADIGIEPKSVEERDAWNRALTLGQYHLLPKDVMREASKIERAGRGVLLANSLRTHWGQFVPAARYQSWRAQNDALRSAYMAFADRLIEDWEAMIRRVRTDFYVIGARNYQQLRRDGADVGDSEYEYATAFVTRMLRKLETPETVRDTYRWWHDTSYVPLTPGVTSAGDSFVGTGDPLADDIARTTARNLAGGVQQFAADLQAALRERVLATVADALAGIRANDGALPGNSTAALKRLVDAVDALKFWPDAALEARMAQLSALCEVKAKDRDNAEVQSVLRELGAESRLLLLELNRPPERSTVEDGIPDDASDLVAFLGSRDGPAFDGALSDMVESGFDVESTDRYDDLDRAV